MKRILFLYLPFAAVSIVGCSASKNVQVTSQAALKAETENIQNTMQEEGFDLAAKNTISLESKRQDQYTFKEPNGNTMEYIVSYNLSEDEGLLYVENVSLDGCKTTDPSQYVKFCGDNAPVQKLNALPKDAIAKKFSAGKLVFNLVGAPLIILGVIGGIGWLVLTEGM